MSLKESMTAIRDAYLEVAASVRRLTTSMDAEINVRIRQGGETAAADGAAALADRIESSPADQRAALSHGEHRRGHTALPAAGLRPGGQAAVLRDLSRAERAPGTIAAI